MLAFIYFLKFLLLFNYSCLHFSPSLHTTPAKPTSLPHPHPPPWFCPCVLYSSSWKPLSPLVFFDKETYDKLCKKLPNYKLITPAVVSERLKIRGSLARAALQELLSKGHIKLVSKHRAKVICIRNTKGGDAPAVGEDAWTTGPTSCTFWKIKLY